MTITVLCMQNQTNMEVKMRTHVMTVASKPIKDSSFLGSTASTLCADMPIFWTYENSDYVAGKTFFL